MKDLKFAVKGSLDPLPPKINVQLAELEISVNNIINEIDTFNLRIKNLEYHLCIGDYLNEEDEDMQDLQDREGND